MNQYTLTLLTLFPALAFAAGPLTIEGADGNSPVRYENPAISLNFDIGSLGAKNNDEADALVVAGFSLWNSVNTATISLTQGSDLPVDIDSSNYDSYIPEDAFDNSFNDGDNLNPVIYDDDGSIIDAFFGINQSDSIVGFATSIYLIGGAYYEDGYAVINGKDLGLNDTQLTLLVAHEIGHFIGLDHTLIHITETASNTCTTKSRDVYPLMYPYVCRNVNSLHQDDISSISSLYPSTNINTSYGQINGHFTQVNSAAILGANIYARNISVVPNRVYSSVITDYLEQGTGFFSLYLPPGDYTLHANSMNTLFTGGSSVGPYSLSSGDESFQAPNPITAVSFQGSTAGSNETLTVIAGTAVDVEFKLDGSGTFTTNGVIFTPDSTVAATSSGGGSGGITPAILLMLLTAITLRLLRRK